MILFFFKSISFSVPPILYLEIYYNNKAGISGVPHYIADK